MTDPQVPRYHKSIDGVASPDGAWCLFSDVSALLIAQAAQVEQLKNENDDLRSRVAAGATTPGTGSTAASNQPLPSLPEHLRTCGASKEFSGVTAVCSKRRGHDGAHTNGSASWGVHRWTTNDPRWPSLQGLPFCGVCGLVQRRDGRNGPCREITPRITFREEQR